MMDPNDRLIEIMPELLGEVREMKDELKGFRSDASFRFENLKKAVDKNTEEVAKLQLSTSELRLSNMALARELRRSWTWTED
jgi:hypothetical protein